MKSRVLKNALCCTLDPPVIEQADLRIADGTITERGKDLHTEASETVEDVRGHLLLPGLVCAHTHLYSSLSRGMPAPAEQPKNFTEILEKVWWKLDKALDEESIYFGALAGALEAVRCGVTTIVDHHASPNAIAGSLGIIEKALDEIGVRGILCYETSDRDGVTRRDQGLLENEEFLSRHNGHAMRRGLVGAHASFTLSDDTMKSLGNLAERFGVGVHVHLAEDSADPRRTEAIHGRKVLERFKTYGFLKPRSVFAHCIHLTEEDFAVLRSAGPWLIHNPRSNMNNAVGHAPVHHFGMRAALGTDGFPADMFEELREAFFKNQETHPRADVPAILGLLQNGQHLVSEVFGRPFGTLDRGSPADIITLDYTPPTPMSAENLASHILFGIRSSMVDSVMINGVWVMRRRKFEHLKEHELLQETSVAAANLWSRMHG